MYAQAHTHTRIQAAVYDLWLKASRARFVSLWMSYDRTWKRACVCVCVCTSQTHGSLPVKTHCNTSKHTPRHECVHAGIRTHTRRDVQYVRTRARLQLTRMSARWGARLKTHCRGGDGRGVIKRGMLSVMCMNDEYSKVSCGEKKTSLTCKSLINYPGFLRKEGKTERRDSASIQGVRTSNRNTI